MSGSRPFKFGTGKAPAGFEGGAKQAARPSHNMAATNQHAVDEGETLVEAGVEETPPDYEVDSATPKEAGQNHGEDHAQRPTYERSNPWPAAKAVRQTPMKLNG